MTRYRQILGRSFAIAIALLLLGSTRASKPIPAGQGPVVGSCASKIDSLAPDAGGIFLAEVIDLSEHDERSSDLDQYQGVTLRILRGTGNMLQSLQLVRASSGFTTLDPNPPPPPTPRFSVKPDYFTLHKRYWFATSRPYGSLEYPNRLAGVWSESSEVAPLLSRAIEEDAYAWHPQRWLDGWVTGWTSGSAPRTTRLRAWRDKRLLWDREFIGDLTHGYEGWYVLTAGDLGNLSYPGFPADAIVFLAEMRSEAKSGNSWGLPAGSWRYQNLIDMKSGKILATRVLEDPGDDFERRYRAYDSYGRLTYERFGDRVSQGGHLVGGTSNTWIRRVVRLVDPEAGTTRSLEVSRRHEAGEGGQWIAVDTKLGLALAPLDSLWHGALR